MIARRIKAINAQLMPKHLYYDPEWLVLGVNNICNLHCKMCDVGVDYNKSNFYENLMGSRPINMPLELITTIIEQAAEYFPKVKLGYAFTEPMIYPHLVESLALADSKGLYTSVTTNALNLRRYADGLLQSGLNDLFISLDGPEEIHNEIRGHKSSFQKAVEGMQYLFGKPNAPEISIYCCITEWNIGYLEAFLEYFKDMPLKRIGFMHTNYTPQEVADAHNLRFGKDYPATPSNMSEINLDKFDIPALYEEVMRIKSKSWGFPVSFSPELETLPQFEVFYHHPDIILGKRCNDVFANIMIKSNGDVIPAHGRCYNLTIGNLYQNNLKEIWNSEIIGRFRKDLIGAGGLMPACSRCCSAF